jgi:hypothetical protein
MGDMPRGSGLLLLLLSSVISLSCASGNASGMQGPVLDDPIRAPVSSAVVQKVTRCQTAADCGAAPSPDVGYACQQQLCTLVSALRAQQVNQPDSSSPTPTRDASEDATGDAPARPEAATKPADATASDAASKAAEEAPL